MGINNAVNAVPPGWHCSAPPPGPLGWLKDQSRTADVVAALKTDPAVTESMRGRAGVCSEADLAAFCTILTDARTPDIILFPSGTVYPPVATATNRGSRRLWRR